MHGDLHALSPDTESWVHVGRLGTAGWACHQLMTLCTGELAALTQYEFLHVKLLSVKGIWQAFKLIA